jgi:hypothetical protein
MNEKDIAARVTDEPMCFPSAEVLRMLRAIVLLALQEAARYGVYRASFQGFRVQALRQISAPGADAFVEVKFQVSLGKAVVDQSVVAMDILQLPSAGLSARPKAATIDTSAMGPRS